MSVLFLGEADTEPHTPQDHQECANRQNLEQRFLILIEKWDFNVIAAGTAVIMVTGQSSARIVSSVAVHNISRKMVPFETEEG